MASTKLCISVGALGLFEKNGDETPETGTPPARSSSPSSPRSDGEASGRSAPSEERSSARPEPCGYPAQEVTSSATDAKAVVAPAIEINTEIVETAIEINTEIVETRSEVVTETAIEPKKGKEKKSNRKEKNKKGNAQSPIDSLAIEDRDAEFSDRCIVEALAASVETHERLMHTARFVEDLLMADDSASTSEDATVNAEGADQVESQRASNPRRVALYGSLSYDMANDPVPPEVFDQYKDAPEEAPETTEDEPRDWHSYYVTQQSDVDLVVLLEPQTSAAEVAQQIMDAGSWKVVSATNVPKFATTQFTLLGSIKKQDQLAPNEKTIREETSKQDSATEDAAKASTEERKSEEVRLDLTCIDSQMHFCRFKERQDAFQRTFTIARRCMERRFGVSGALAFDAYIHLLKAFAANVPGTALTGFQATCLGLFTLQLGLYEFMGGLTPSALTLFECFLRFCITFYGELGPHHWAHLRGHQHCAIDLAFGGRLLPRFGPYWRSEMYFMDAEARLQTRPDERMNIAHSLVPHAVATKAKQALIECFSSKVPRDKGGKGGAKKEERPPSRPVHEVWRTMSKSLLHLGE